MCRVVQRVYRVERFPRKEHGTRNGNWGEFEFAGLRQGLSFLEFRHGSGFKACMGFSWPSVLKSDHKPGCNTVPWRFLSRTSARRSSG